MYYTLYFVQSSHAFLLPNILLQAGCSSMEAVFLSSEMWVQLIPKTRTVCAVILAIQWVACLSLQLSSLTWKLPDTSTQTEQKNAKLNLKQKCWIFPVPSQYFCTWCHFKRSRKKTRCQAMRFEYKALSSCSAMSMTVNISEPQFL